MAYDVNIGNYAPFYRQVAVSSSSDSGSAASSKTRGASNSDSTGTEATEATKSALGKDDFLKLLIAQLTHQVKHAPGGEALQRQKGFRAGKFAQTSNLLEIDEQL